MEIKGVGKDADIISNEQGGLQTKLDYAFYLTDPIANFKLAGVFSYGEKKYTRDNWRLIEVDSHLNHALTHINAYFAGDTQDDHLEHALCRLHMAVAKKHRPEYLGFAEKGKTK